MAGLREHGQSLSYVPWPFIDKTNDRTHVMTPPWLFVSPSQVKLFAVIVFEGRTRSRVMIGRKKNKAFLAPRKHAAGARKALK
jgi:hypothetical protein